MKGLTNSVKWVTAAAVLVAMPTVASFAGTPASGVKTTPATDKKTDMPAVPRAIPDLTKYGKFDPPTAKIFDFKNLTISGDMRVRPEFRSKGCFGGGGGGTCTSSAGTMRSSGDSNDFYTQQLIRLGFNYDISPDVRFFTQAQVSHNFGATDSGVNPNSTSTDFFLRQGFMLVRNFVVPNLSIKAGRQLMVWGNHRIFGHFDWNNVGFAFDGVTFRYNNKMMPVEFGWLRVAENNIGQNAGGTNPAGAGKANQDGDIIFVRVPTKIAGITVEPAWIWETGGAAGQGGTTAAGGGQAHDQSLHTLGGRATTKKGMFDAPFEGYYQIGKIDPDGNPGGRNVDIRAYGNPGGRNVDIRAYALHFDAGATLPVAMQPRIGAEINYGSGDSDNSATSNTASTFSQLFPTNHIHFGYMDLMAWQNMMTWGGKLELRPNKNSHFEVAGHSMRLAKAKDNWYRANQGTYFASDAQNSTNSLGWELDVVYTLFFQGNHVGWQVGYGHFFAGQYVEEAASRGGIDESDQDWGYTQLWINF